MYGKYVLVKLRALDAEIVSPRIIIPAWSSLIPTDLSIDSFGDSKNKAKVMPNNNAAKGDPDKIAVKAKIIPINSFIYLNVL